MEYTDAPFTILAPSNAASSASAETLLLLGERASSRAVRQHLILDEEIRLEAMLAGGPQRRTTAGGRDVTFRIDEDGEEEEGEMRNQQQHLQQQ